MERIAIFGLPGTGKTTLARQLAEQLDLPHYDLDRALFTADGARPLPEFRAAVAKLTAGPRWVADGNFSKLRDLTWHRAQLVIWLDYRLPVIMWRVTRRSIRRIAGRETGWGHNPTTWRTAFLGRRSILANAIRKYVRNRRKYQRYLNEPEMRAVQIVRVGSPRAARRWRTGLLHALQHPAPPAGPPRHGVSVAAVVIDDDGRILLTCRRDNGRWEIPGGILEHDETLHEGLIREVAEETGLTIEPGELSGIYHNLHGGVLNLVFRGSPHRGSITPTTEASEVCWLTLDQAQARTAADHVDRILDAMQPRPAVVRVTEAVASQNPLPSP